MSKPIASLATIRLTQPSDIDGGSPRQTFTVNAQGVMGIDLLDSGIVVVRRALVMQDLYVMPSGAVGLGPKKEAPSVSKA